MNSHNEEMKSEKRQLLKEYIEENMMKNENLFNGNQDAIFVLDLKGLLLQVNPAFEKLSGYSYEEALQMKLQMFFPIEGLKAGIPYLE
ncbi:PAS domain S-box protein [Neobacillus sp. NRS-1170]|uniref:PAS domain S-box protein n=1 Tax=Neobacillus sp. NRS-1170 TaxID=3233898 RepID=UPI003D2C28DC